MPTYDYECDACGHKFELFQSITEPVERKCPECKKPKLRRLFGTGAAIVFKGSGFYQTDYRSDSYKKAASADSSKAESKSDGQPAKSADGASSTKNDGAADKSLRNRDFPNTYISHIDVDLTSPHHWVRLTWTGPLADRQNRGPFHSSPGAGLGTNNCDDVAESNRDGSNCTPKGEFAVEAFSDTMRTYTQCRFVTWFDVRVWPRLSTR